HERAPRRGGCRGFRRGSRQHGEDRGAPPGRRADPGHHRDGVPRRRAAGRHDTRADRGRCVPAGRQHAGPAGADPVRHEQRHLPARQRALDAPPRDRPGRAQDQEAPRAVAAGGRVPRSNSRPVSRRELLAAAAPLGLIGRGCATVTPEPAPAVPGSSGSYGLDFPGDGRRRRMLYWRNPFPIYDATYVFKVYPRKKTSGAHRYYTTFFWGNDGEFAWDRGNANTYYGAHPYPTPAPAGPRH